MAIHRSAVHDLSYYLITLTRSRTAHRVHTDGHTWMVERGIAIRYLVAHESSALINSAYGIRRSPNCIYGFEFGKFNCAPREKMEGGRRRFTCYCTFPSQVDIL